MSVLDATLEDLRWMEIKKNWRWWRTWGCQHGAASTGGAQLSKGVAYRWQVYIEGFTF